MREENALKSSASTGATEHVSGPTRLPAWTALGECVARLGATRTDAMFRANPQRFEDHHLRHDGLLVDLSKQRIDAATRTALLSLAREAHVAEAIGALFAGEALNFTEGRPALHMALRGSCPAPAEDAATLADTNRRIRAFARALREGQVRGALGDPIRRVINLGIGGSDLGPRMLCQALRPAADTHAPEVGFVANIDPRELDDALAHADPRTTLFIVSSKSFTTLETLANARAAREWLHSGLGEGVAIAPHLVAVSNDVEAAIAFGVPAEQVFPVPDWVGGRFSTWSAIGLPVLAAIGERAFDALLAGARSMDAHFRDAPPAANLPLAMALAGIWNDAFLDCESLAVLPYAHGLRGLPAWLQQLEMESNGKRCRRDGQPAETNTAPIVFGHEGTVGQHAFHQLLYQGTRRVAADFIVPVGGCDERQRNLVENALAQSAALMEGLNDEGARALLRDTGCPPEEVERLAPHLVCPGNLPSTTVLVPSLTPHALGQLMALYEHKVFVQGWIWSINSFDQYGVELGKRMARRIAEPGHRPSHPATEALLQAVEAMRSTN